MTKQRALFVIAAVLMVGNGCASDPAVEVRAVNTHRAATGDELGLAQASLALGNIGLALEQFRQALRAHPGSFDALGGIALCYDYMGRLDLSRRYYEEALALAPGDTRLLMGYATALARHGAVSEAQAVMSEIALRTEGSAARPVKGTVPAKPATPLPPSTDFAASDPLAARPALPGVRLQRISLGEIALVTKGSTLWVALPAARPARPVLLLNAARRDGLASRHRKLLRSAGWQSVAIGDAPRTRRSSLVLYPAAQGKEARRIATKLRIAAIRPESRADIIVLLGSDRG